MVNVWYIGKVFFIIGTVLFTCCLVVFTVVLVSTGWKTAYMDILFRVGAVSLALLMIGVVCAVFAPSPSPGNRKW